MWGLGSLVTYFRGDGVIELVDEGELVLFRVVLYDRVAGLYFRYDVFSIL